MGEETERFNRRIVVFTEAALADLANIDNTTAAMWGEVQAERYLGFLRELLSVLAQNPLLASEVHQRPGFLVYTAKYRQRKSAHGHRVFFRVVDGGIEVVRILHTAMYWPDHLDQS